MAPAWTTFAKVEKTWAYRQDQLPSTHPIAADIPDIEAVEVNFDGITYAKGAAVLKQLVAYVGRENFIAGLRSTSTSMPGATPTLGDLLAPLEQTSGRDLSDWSKKWLETAGRQHAAPRVPGRRRGQDHAVRRAPGGPGQPPDAPPAPPRDRALRRDDGGLTAAPGRDRRRRRPHRGARAGRLAQPDLVLVNDDDLTYAKIRLDEHSLRTLITAIGEFTESLPSALCWAAAWDMCRDGEMAARDYVRLVLSGVETIETIPVLQTLLGQAATAARRFADPAWRATGLAEMADTLRGLLQRAEPGSDRQLAYAQAFCGVAISPAMWRCWPGCWTAR